jgi:hypothetical protein
MMMKSDVINLASVDMPRSLAVSQGEPAGETSISVFRAAKLVSARGQLFCLVRSISSIGLTGDLNLALPKGEQVKVLLGSKFVGATVSASDGSTIELAFQEAIDVELWLGGPAAERRVAPRVEVDCPARLMLGTQAIFVRVRDISQEGACIESEDILLEGDEPTITLRNWKAIRASVAWVDGNLAGLKFARPVALRELSNWLADCTSQAQRMTSEAIQRIARQ